MICCCVHVCVFEVMLFSRINISNLYTQDEVRQSCACVGSHGNSSGYGMRDDYKSNVLVMTETRYRDTL